MQYLIRVLPVLLSAALAWATPASAATPARPTAPPNVNAAVKACKPGQDPQKPGLESHPGGFLKSGLTPQAIAGAVTVSPREAKCLVDKLGAHLVVVQAMYDSRKLPRAREVPDAGSAAEGENTQQRVAEQLGRLTGGDAARPLLVYCHHTSCPFSYNAALRAVKAGYSRVYWLREGNSGWFAAGYPKDGEQLDEKGFPEVYAGEVESCDKRVTQFTAQKFAELAVATTDDARLEESFRAARTKAAEQRALCLRLLKSRFETNPAVQSHAASLLARNETEVAEYFQASRRQVEDDPRAMFKDFLDAMDVASLSETLERARGLKSLAQLCGPLKPTLPTEQSQLDAAIAHEKAYAACLQRVHDDASDAIDAKPFAVAATVVAGMARYACANRQHAKCLPHAALRRVADVASPGNGKLVLAAAERRARRQDVELDAAVDDLLAWKDRRNQHIRQLNARIEETNARTEREQDKRSYTPSYSAPSYSAPSYDPPGGRYGNGRRDSSTSAPGIK